MHFIGNRASHVMRHPLSFALQTVKAFRANQGLLLAGAVAYYSLLSIVPLLILFVIAFSHVIPQGELLQTLGHYLEWLVPGQSRAIVSELAGFLDHKAVLGSVLLVTMLFFSSLAFSALENAMSVIFLHRFAVRRRHPLLSALLPYCCMLCLGAGLLVMTVVAGGLQLMGELSVQFFVWQWSLEGISGLLLYLLGVLGEVSILTAIYMVMPVGRLSLRHALVGGVSATVLWEITRHVLVWYFSSLSQANIVYGSLTTAILVLLTLEIAATLLLFGAQVISEYERIGPLLTPGRR